MIQALFLDIGGVLMTNGWDHVLRKKTAETFSIDYVEMNDRHQLIFDTYEMGKLTFDEYLKRIIFYEKRPYSMQDVKEYIFSAVCPFEEMMHLVREIKKEYRLKVGVVSNEGRELAIDRMIWHPDAGERGHARLAHRMGRPRERIHLRGRPVGMGRRPDRVRTRRPRRLDLELTFTQHGLVPDLECYDVCSTPGRSSCATACAPSRRAGNRAPGGERGCGARRPRTGGGGRAPSAYSGGPLIDSGRRAVGQSVRFVL